MDIKRGMNIAAAKFIDRLEEFAKPIETRKDLMNLAMISTNNDFEISEVISTGLIELGVSGIINIEQSMNGFSELIVIIFIIKISKGMTIANGLASLDFISDPNEKE